MGLDRIPSAALVEGLLADWSKEKRDAAKKREHIDCDQLVASGRWLSPEVRTFHCFLRRREIQINF